MAAGRVWASRPQVLGVQGAASPVSACMQAGERVLPRRAATVQPPCLCFCSVPCGMSCNALIGSMPY